MTRMMMWNSFFSSRMTTYSSALMLAMQQSYFSSFFVGDKAPWWAVILFLVDCGQDDEELRFFPVFTGQDFDDLYRETHKIANTIIHDWHGAFDVVQETLIRVRDCDEHPRGLVRYVKRAVRNGAFDVLRKRLRHPTHTVATAFLDMNTGHLPGPEPAAMEKETRCTVHEALDRLAEPYKTTLPMHYIDGHPQRTIASMLGVSTAAVNSRLHKGRSILRKELGATIGRDMAWRPDNGQTKKAEQIRSNAPDSTLTSTLPPSTVTHAPQSS